jgi:hypothetical protein
MIIAVKKRDGSIACSNKKQGRRIFVAITHIGDILKSAKNLSTCAWNVM